MPNGSMLVDANASAHRGDPTYAIRVVRAMDAHRLGAVALVTLLLSLEGLSSPAVLDFFSPAEVALAWLEHLTELAVLASILMVAYTLVDEALHRASHRLRLAICCATLFALSFLLSLSLYGYYAHGFGHLPPFGRLLSDALRFGIPAVFLVLIADVHRRALQIDSAAHAAELSRAQLGQDEGEQQLALLQAQIEPHFLFNVLGNVRRLYRTQPRAGSEAIVSLMRYLRAALPQLRTERASLRDELELVRAYLDLLKVRMGARLTFRIDAAPVLDDLEFPPMLIVTLVENAIKHGLEPIGGGTVIVSARVDNGMLHVAVIDDGAGLGTAASGGTGVGLSNVRRQLAARYNSRARFVLQASHPRGTAATMSIPVLETTPTSEQRECIA